MKPQSWTSTNFPILDIQRFSQMAGVHDLYSQMVDVQNRDGNGKATAGGYGKGSRSELGSSFLGD
jgi:hypothetical protein